MKTDSQFNVTSLPALRKSDQIAPWKKGDVLVLFGELFSKGYANGLVEEAEKRGMTIVRATVGRREKDGILRALTAEEAETIPKPFINIPLEAGFDLEPDEAGLSPVDHLKDVKLSDWENFKFEKSALAYSKKKAIERFKTNTQKFLKELEQYIPESSNVLFAHLMAGGVPRVKVVMPLINRIVKGTGDRYLPSAKLWESSIGQFCNENFFEVTAETFRHLIQESSALRNKIESKGNHVSYLAYGYHGTEVWIKDSYRWQTYTPYVQGWAKIQLENISKEFSAKGVHCCVYNCPEILTNSSSIFQGVEVSLYSLLHAFELESQKNPQTEIPKRAQRVLKACAELLKNGDQDLETLKKLRDEYFLDPRILERSQFALWPQHTKPEQLVYMLDVSDQMTSLHKDPKNLITFILSEEIFHSCGKLMLHDSWTASNPVAWIGHDVIARCP